ncbi:MAG: hypothetical protein AAGD25_15185 [Cyanobacteria bacterium P01_F01_bin.150]
MTLSSKRPHNVSIASQQTPKFVIALMVLAASQAINVLIILGLLFNNGSLARKQRVYVQTPEGTSKQAIQVDPLHREPDVLKTTTQAFLQYFFEWSKTLPNGEPDHGIDAYGTTIPSKVYIGSYLVEPGFRPQLLKAMGETVIPDDVLNGSLESTVIIHQLSEPQKTAPGAWSIRVVAVRIDRNSKGELQELTFTRRIDLKAIHPQASALLEQDKDSPFSESIRLLLQNGVIITNMVEG